MLKCLVNIGVSFIKKKLKLLTYLLTSPSQELLIFIFVFTILLGLHPHWGDFQEDTWQLLEVKTEAGQVPQTGGPGDCWHLQVWLRIASCGCRPSGRAQSHFQGFMRDRRAACRSPEGHATQLRPTRPRRSWGCTGPSSTWRGGVLPWGSSGSDEVPCFLGPKPWAFGGGRGHSWKASEWLQRVQTQFSTF